MKRKLEEIFDFIIDRPIYSIAFILILRNILTIISPELPLEDGTELFAYYINNNHFSSILQVYAGYISLIPNLLAYLTINILPLSFIPHTFVLFSIILSILAHTIFISDKFKHVIPEKRKRSIICIIIASLPLGNFAIDTMLMYSFWNLTIIFIFLNILMLENEKKWYQVLSSILIVFTTPLSILFFPLIFIKTILEKKITIKNICIVISMLAMLIITLKTKNTGSSLIQLSEALISTIQAIGYRVIIESTVGGTFRNYIQSTLGNNIYICVALLLLFVLFIYNKRKSIDLFSFSIFTYVIGAFIFASIVTRGDAIVTSSWEQRYFYVSKYFFLMGFLTLIINTKWLMKNKVSLLIIFSSYATTINISSIYYYARIPKFEIQKFIENIDSGQCNNYQNRLERGERWSIKIDCNKL